MLIEKGLPRSLLRFTVPPFCYGCLRIGIGFSLLNAGDYPIVAQDDLLHILSYLPKNLSFVNHSSYIN
ncbi:hypothetical protein F3Y22_tig00112536pilonHSYRG00024 [Hibiscus syriacus]|uniref:Uncharacterized protein n=1 Tax=Hibiscus syriacus TaxID=106335 RepID=A0A6A2WVC6_HIBSY|nr:hypothetical protein F3Y22_tig00112536pilonHSYRG00024 [Hibiscus syriacus]